MLEKTVWRPSGYESKLYWQVGRARLEIELVLTRWGKTNVFLKHFA